MKIIFLVDNRTFKGTSKQSGLTLWVWISTISSFAESLCECEESFKFNNGFISPFIIELLKKAHTWIWICLGSKKEPKTPQGPFKFEKTCPEVEVANCRPNIEFILLSGDQRRRTTFEIFFIPANILKEIFRTQYPNFSAACFCLERLRELRFFKELSLGTSQLCIDPFTSMQVSFFFFKPTTSQFTWNPENKPYCFGVIWK
jgi:hypothetical protein